MPDKLKTYEVEYFQKISIDCFKVKATNEKEAEDKAYNFLYKNDRDFVSSHEVREIDEDN